MAHKSTHGFEYWENHKEEIIDMYVNKHLSSTEIAKYYDCSMSTILHYLKQWKVPIRRIRYNATYNVDYTFFDKIDTEEKAYIVGLLLSDGHISKADTIMLTLKDRDVIEKYKIALKCDIPIKTDRYGNYYVNIKCTKLSDDLKKMGFHNRKSYSFDLDRLLPYIPKELEHHFVRGLFDGDGSIAVYKYDYLKNPQYHFGFTGLKQIVDYVKVFLNIHTKTVTESEITYTCVSSCRETINNIYKILYKDATIYMDRKYETFNRIIQQTFNDYNR